jgi:hypothetical protein
MNKITLSNQGSHPATNLWVRRTWDGIHITQPLTSGRAYLIPTNIRHGDVQLVDVRIDRIDAGQQVEIHPVTFGPATDWTKPSLAKIAQQMGFVLLDGVAMGFVADGSSFDGVFASLHLRTHDFSGWVDVWLEWSPLQPYVATGIMTITHGREDSQELAWIDQERDVLARLRVGNGIVVPYLPKQTGPWRAFDGQTRRIPFAVFWPGLARDAGEWINAALVANQQIRGHGIGKLWPVGNPHPTPRPWKPVDWMRRHHAEAKMSLALDDGWPSIGPAKQSGVTGAQEDQIFHPGSEAMRPDGIGCELVRWLAAHNQAKRDGAYLDQRGEHIGPESGVRLWDGIIDFRFTPEAARRGKTRQRTLQDSLGMQGPDTQHWLINTKVAAARLTGCPVLQKDLEGEVQRYLMTRSRDPRSAQSATFSAREWGYECWNVVLLHENLRNRGMAWTVFWHLSHRMDLRLEPLALAGADLIHTFTDDRRLGDGEWTICWQDAWAAYGIDVACDVLFGEGTGDQLRQFARRIAERVWWSAWRKVGDQWQVAPALPTSYAPGLDTEQPVLASGWVYEDAGIGEPPASLTDAPPDVWGTSFLHYGMPCALAVLLRHDPDHPCREAWDYLLRSDDTVSRRWMPPLELA